MLIAAPTIEGRFCSHFGKSDGMYLCEVDLMRGTIDQPHVVRRNAKGCDSLPMWLDALAVQCVVAGGIGASARLQLLQRGIRVSAGHVGDSPEDAVRHYLADPDARHPNGCSDHDHEHRHCRH
jgi:predicted Fe-Mo cluster-binding NifX family protein